MATASFGVLIYSRLHNEVNPNDLENYVEKLKDDVKPERFYEVAKTISTANEKVPAKAQLLEQKNKALANPKSLTPAYQP